MLIEAYNPLEGKMLQVVDEAGEVRESLVPDLGDAELTAIYKWMVLARTADDKAFALQREGRMGTYAQLKGHEAIQIGSALALQGEDWFVPHYRDLGAMALRGVPVHLTYLYWMGNEAGSHFPEGVRVFPITVPVGSQIPIAVGVAWAAKMRHEPSVALVSFGDGATSQGDFHDGMNFAGVFRTPTVFLCQNNQWAISVPRSRQTASQTLAQKAFAYGFAGLQVDGNDVLAVYAAVKECVERAREGKGPTLIEAVTYRLTDHTTADDASRYRSQEEVAGWVQKEPIKRFQRFLVWKGLWNKSLSQEAKEEAEARVAEAVGKAETFPDPTPRDLFRYTFHEMTGRLDEELKELEQSVDG